MPGVNNKYNDLMYKFSTNNFDMKNPTAFKIPIVLWH